VLASDLPKRLVTQAWLAKHQLNAPAQVRRSARFKQKRRGSSSRLTPAIDR